MRKKYTILTGMFLLALVIVTAEIISNILPADFIAPVVEEPIQYSGKITFEVDGKPFSCYLSERDMDIGDDFEKDCLKEHQRKRITNIKDWMGREYKEITINGTIHRSFNETRLNDLVERFNRN